MQEILQQNSEQLKQVFQKEGVTLAYLFGSQARRTAGPQSDIDIAALFSQEPQNCFAKRISLASSIENALRLRNADLICLHEAPPLLRHRAVLSGKLLYAATPSTKREMELRALQEYEDFKYHLSTANTSMRRHIARKSFGKAPLPLRSPHVF
jgi:predicted nucleotidyltransferase